MKKNRKKGLKTSTSAFSYLHSAKQLATKTGDPQKMQLALVHAQIATAELLELLLDKVKVVDDQSAQGVGDAGMQDVSLIAEEVRKDEFAADTGN